MAKTRSDIITLPNRHLRDRSTKVGLIDEDVLKLVKDMESATLDWEDHRKHEVGVALAAIQIDVPMRVVIVRNDFDKKSDRTFHSFINPKITKYEGELIEDFEGCLSVKDIYGKVPRYTKVKLTATGLDGKQIRLSAEGFLARVLQHEIDHTNGKVFIDHIKGQPEAFYKLNQDGELEKIDYEKDIANSNLFRE